MKKTSTISTPADWSGEFFWRLFLLLAISVVATASAHSQERSAILSGRVTGSDGDPIEFATIHLLPQGATTVTNAEGAYAFERVTPGRVQLKVDFLGMESIDTTFTVAAGRETRMDFQMRATTLRLTDISVVGQEGRSAATSSTISRQAMDHLQTSSLNDVMQLLPGGVTVNTSMTTAQTLTIRDLGGTASNMNSMGTAIVMDGAPLSNNANLQTLSPTISGGGGVVGGGSSPNSGLDVRSISTDNIESIEVIRGIASVAYGDATSGVVLVRSKAGREPFTIRFKTDPRIYQASLGGGMNLGGRAGALNLSGDYLHSLSDVTESYSYYERFTANAKYSNLFGKLSSTTSFHMWLGKDTRERNPDDERSQIASGSRDLGLRFNTHGVWNVNQGWLTDVTYVAAGGLRDRHSHYEQLLGNAFAPYSMSLTDGAVLSNKPGQRIYHVDGSELTNIPASEQAYSATFLPNEYFSRYDIYGKEVNAYAKVTANFSKQVGTVNNRFLLGVDLKTDGNLGDGKVYDLNNPPYRVLSSANASSRPRKYSSIPFLNQFAVFAEENLTWSFASRQLEIQAGLRFDSFNGKYALAPRTNLSFDILPRTLWLRGGYGLHTKAPTALYLNPENAYFDFVHFNTLNSSLVPENEQAILVSTRVFETGNPHLKIATNQKAELGFDLQIRRMRFSVTAYNEHLDRGYNLGHTAENFKLIDYVQYEEGEQVPGSVPKLVEKQTDRVFVSYASPMNNVKGHNRGVEFDFNFGRFPAIRTSFVLNGAYMRTTGWLDEHRFSSGRNLNSLERNVGIYSKDFQKDENERFVTTLRAIHHLPSIGFVLTGTAQVNWVDNSWTNYGNDTMFVSYISRIDGKVRPFKPADRNDPEFAYMFESRNDTRFIREYYQPVLLVNFHLTKEIGDNMRASFYANNMINNRPLYESKRSPGSFSRLNIPMYFGFEFSVKIR